MISQNYSTNSKNSDILFYPYKFTFIGWQSATKRKGFFFFFLNYYYHSSFAVYLILSAFAWFRTFVKIKNVIIKFDWILRSWST